MTRSGTPVTPEGMVSGALLAATRKSLGRTQDGLAETLGMQVDALKGWESGRRPLAKVPAGRLLRARRQMLALGAAPRLVGLLDVAMDVDLFIAQVLTGDTTPDQHYLASWVLTRDWCDLLLWTLTGAVPDVLRDQPGIRRPDPGAEVRRYAFDQLRTAADQAGPPNGNPASTLLRRQVHYVTACDDSSDGREWLAATDRRQAKAMRGAGWSHDWVGARSLAIARARQGDPTWLHEFIASRLANDDACEAANLAYWAYWIGESHSHATGDDFMVNDNTWRGDRLLTHLTTRLAADVPYVDLTAHTLYALTAARPHLLTEDSTRATILADHAGQLLDNPPDTLTARGRLEVSAVRTAARASVSQRRDPR